MSTLETVENLLQSLTLDERRQLLQMVVRQLGGETPGIQSLPDVCGGEPCIVRTRIPIWLLEQARRQGVSEAQLLQSYPTLQAADLIHAWTYASEHVGEVNRQIRENEDA